MVYKVIASNRKAKFQYNIIKTFEVGLVLFGTEVKSIREGNISLLESYCIVDSNMEVYLLNAHIAEYSLGNRNNHEPIRKRKLLLHKSEIKRIYGQIKKQGMTLIPVKIFFKKGLIKLELGLAIGKKLYDKRQTLKKRDAQREIERSLKNI